MSELKEAENIPKQESPKEYEIKELEFNIDAINIERAGLQKLLDHIEKEKKAITDENAYRFNQDYLKDIRNDASGIRAEAKRQIEKIDKILKGLTSRLKEIK